MDVRRLCVLLAVVTELVIALPRPSAAHTWTVTFESAAGTPCKGASLLTRLRGGQLTGFGTHLPGLADEPTEPPPLRFNVGDRIMAKASDGWRPGTIVYLNYKEADWPEDKVAPYQIELDNGALIYAQVDSEELVISRPDVLTLEDLAMHLATARAKYLNASDVPDEAVCRLMLTTRMENLPLFRARSAPSLVAQGEVGLFVTRDVAEGELITLVPADGALMWDEKERSPESKVRLFFGSHVAPQDRTLSVTEWPDTPCHEKMNIVSDPRNWYDTAYLGHLAKDFASCYSPDQKSAYVEQSEANANAEIIPMDVSATDAHGNPLLLHLAQRALKPIKKGEEVLVSYGYDFWARSFTEASAV